MLSEKEKGILEEFIAFHKLKGGTVSHESHRDFRALPNVKKKMGAGFYSLRSIIDKSIAIGWMKYTLADRTGLTSLTKEGWDFTTFETHEKLEMSQKEINELTIEKLKTDLINARRQAKMFIPLTIMTIVLGLISIITSISSYRKEVSLRQLEKKQNLIESKLDSIKEIINRNEVVQVEKDGKSD